MFDIHVLCPCVFLLETGAGLHPPVIADASGGPSLCARLELGPSKGARARTEVITTLATTLKVRTAFCSCLLLLFGRSTNPCVLAASELYSQLEHGRGMKGFGKATATVVEKLPMFLRREPQVAVVGLQLLAHTCALDSKTV